MSTERYTNEELRKRKGHVDHAKINAATEEQIAAWKREDGFDDATLGSVRAVPPITDVRALREKLGLSQEEFAQRYMLSLRTVQEWEQRRREPSDAARVLLYAIAQDPAAIARVLHPNAAEMKCECACMQKPFVPNAETIAAMEEARHGNLQAFANVDDLMKELNAPD